MRTKTYILVAITAFLFVSCKDDKKTEGTGATPESAEKKENFNVEVEVVSEKPDNFPLYYTEDGTNNFASDRVIWHDVKGQAGSQTIPLELSEEIIPTNIRIDFGVKQGDEQGDVTLSKFKMSYYGKNFEIKGSDFLKYFIKNDSVNTEIDDAKGTILFKKNPKSKLTRFYYPQQTILDELKKITK